MPSLLNHRKHRKHCNFACKLLLDAVSFGIEDFSKQDLVSALRQLFDTFKPGGEGQATWIH